MSVGAGCVQVRNVTFALFVPGNAEMDSAGSYGRAIDRAGFKVTLAERRNACQKIFVDSVGCTSTSRTS